jgi:hypothetical protein
VTNPSESHPLRDRLRQAWGAAEFVSLTLSLPAGESDLRKIKVRPVLLKKGWAFSIVRCRQIQELTTNLPPEAAVEWISKEFPVRWGEAHLFTLSGDFKFRRTSDGSVKQRKSRPTFTRAPDSSHDREHPLRSAFESEPFLRRLGVVNPGGQPRPGMAGKLRQIVRFVELVGHLMDSLPRDVLRPVQVADMGAGKGYLTFALARAFEMRRWDADIVGVEARKELVESGNALAHELGFASLRFAHGKIGEWNAINGLDVLVALHACDTATDDALFYGVKAGASLILTSPCCHKEVRAQLEAPEFLEGILKHGILQERQAEIITDGIRALALESCGYDARVFEFVDPEHSGKNLMLAATRRKNAVASRFYPSEKLNVVMRQFGVGRQHLVELLKTIAQ